MSEPIDSVIAKGKETMSDRQKIERLREALNETQSALADVTRPVGNNVSRTVVRLAWANCVAAELHARAALTATKD